MRVKGRKWSRVRSGDNLEQMRDRAGQNDEDDVTDFADEYDPEQPQEEQVINKQAEVEAAEDENMHESEADSVVDKEEEEDMSSPPVQPPQKKKSVKKKKNVKKIESASQSTSELIASTPSITDGDGTESEENESAKQNESTTVRNVPDKFFDKNDPEMMSKLYQRISELENELREIKTISSRTCLSTNSTDMTSLLGDPSIDLNDTTVFQGQKNMKEILHERTLASDTFSFMTISRPNTHPFLLGFAVFFIQMVTFCLVLFNLIDFGSDNPLNIPADVVLPVRCTQLVALIIAVATQEDVRVAFSQFYDGYSDEMFEPFGTVKFGGWLFSSICRLVEGFFGLIATFVLIMTGESVVEILMNFTALEFVSQLDEVVFYLAEQGYTGKVNQCTTVTILETTYYSKRSKRLIRIILLCSILIALLSGWIVVYRKQSQGTFLCDTLHVQFSDAFIPGLAAFSGYYDRKVKASGFQNARVEYVERRSGRARFAYCKKDRAWSFVHEGKGQESAEEIDPCDWIVQSTSSDSFSVLDVSLSTWYLRSGGDSLVPLQYFRMTCRDCEEGTRDGCGHRGVCSDENTCECDYDFFGIECEFDAPCKELVVDERVDEFIGTRDWSSQYKVLARQEQLVQVYERPVYFNEYTPGYFDIIFFTGRRWVVSYSEFLRIDDGDVDSLASFFAAFHAYFSEYEVAYISDSMDSGTPSDASSPQEVEWFRATQQGEAHDGMQSPEGLPLQTSLICGLCTNGTNPCNFDGTCLASQRCDCLTGASGVLCQVTPNGNGHCDPFFNKAAYNFDGGDCCESTCVDGPTWFCGKDQTGFVDIGYTDCTDPSEEWIPNSSPILSERGRFARTGSVVVMSGKGSILVVTDEGSDVVRVFDKRGSDWVQRGRTIEGAPGSGFGRFLAMSSGAKDVVSNPSSVGRFTLVIQETMKGGLGIYDCVKQGCLQASLIENKISTVDSSTTIIGGFDVSSIGDVIAVATSGDKVQFWLRTSDNEWYLNEEVQMIVNFSDASRGRRRLWVSMGSWSGIYLSLAGDATTFLVGSIFTSMEATADRGTVWSGTLFTAQVYKWDELTYAWDVTWDLSIDFDYGSGIENYPKYPLKLSKNGNVLAFIFNSPEKNSTGIEVHAWDGSNWAQRGTSLIHKNRKGDDLSGLSIDMSEDGSVLAVGAVSTTRVYRWNGSEYTQLWNDLPGGQDLALSMDRKGKSIAIGLPTLDLIGPGGSTQVYNYISKCSKGSVSTRVSLTTDDAPHETRWTISSLNGTIVTSGGPYGGEDFATFVEELCLPETDCFTFDIYDDNNNGIASPGGYNIFVNDGLYASGRTFHTTERVRIGPCPAPCQPEEVEVQLDMYTGSSMVLGTMYWSIESKGQVFARKNREYGSISSFSEYFCFPESFDTSCFEVYFVLGTAGSCYNGLLGTAPLHYHLFANQEELTEQSFPLGSVNTNAVGGCHAESRPHPVQGSPNTVKCSPDTRLVQVHTPSFEHMCVGGSWRIASCESPEDTLWESVNVGPFSSMEYACIPIQSCSFLGTKEGSMWWFRASYPNTTQADENILSDPAIVVDGEERAAIGAECHGTCPALIPILETPEIPPDYYDDIPEIPPDYYEDIPTYPPGGVI